MRSLAQRSAEAAKEIKALIGQSTEKVEAGNQLADAAGRTIEKVVDQVREVAELVTVISSAGAEQTTGVEQVNQAVSHLDATTQQNAALVEETAAAAESLRLQATRLSEVVGVFRLQGAALQA